MDKAFTVQIFSLKLRSLTTEVKVRWAWHLSVIPAFRRQIQKILRTSWLDRITGIVECWVQ